MQRTMKCKVCGMRMADNIREVAALGIDMMGFICWPGSPRFVGHTPLPDTKGLLRVGVFVDQPAEEIYSYTRLHRLDAVQLHGNEAPSLLETLRHDCPQLLIIKAISIRDKVDLLKADRYHGLCHLLLFDTRCQCVGGSGQQFSWDMLQHYQGPTPFLISGGIGPEDAERVATLDHPLLEGIDLNSRFETSPALKDTQRLAVFLDRLTRTLSTPIH